MRRMCHLHLPIMTSVPALVVLCIAVQGGCSRIIASCIILRTAGRLVLLNKQASQSIFVKSQVNAGLKQDGVEETLRWRMEIAGDDAGSESDSEDENMVDEDISLQELNRHVSSEEQYVFWLEMVTARAILAMQQPGQALHLNWLQQMAGLLLYHVQGIKQRISVNNGAQLFKDPSRLAHLPQAGARSCCFCSFALLTTHSLGNL